MKVKDLRIGNIVYGGWEDDEENSNNSICLVTGLSEEQYLGEGWNFMLENMERKDVENYFEMKPIPLREEWLLKFGFEKDEYNSDRPYYYTFKGFRLNCNLGFLTLCNSNELADFRPIELKYVHQLQNMFFALCGEELEVKNELKKM